MKRRLCYEENVSIKLKAQVEYLQAVEAGIKESAKKLKTAMNIMAEHLYCEISDECQERTAYRIHQMLNSMKLTMPDDAKALCRHLGLNEYIKDFPSHSQLAEKFKL